MFLALQKLVVIRIMALAGESFAWVEKSIGYDSFPWLLTYIGDIALGS